MGPKRYPINYLYFALFFGVLGLLAAGSIFTKENLGGAQPFFFLYALGQITLEATLFIFIGLLLRRHPTGLALFMGATFFILVLHLFDFMTDRVLDLSIWETIQVFVLNESWGNFLYLLDASGIPTGGWILLFALLASIPLFGIFLYKMTNRAAETKPVRVRSSFFLQTFLCVPCALLLWDFSTSKAIHPDAYTSFTKSLPWKWTFLQPQSTLLSLQGPLQAPLSEEAVAAAIEQDRTVLAKRPNIYLFVIESLREDAITAEIAPHLNQFKNSYTHFDTALSNGNGSHISWFSIFHSQFPYHWQQAQTHWQMGSPALNLLKKWGYQIRLYSSAQLGYYGMEKLLFGSQLQLVDLRQNFHHAPPSSAADTDAAAIAKLQKDIRDDPALQEGQVFIIFWDCTHFDYSWPKNWVPKFTPFAQQLAYFQAFHSQNTIHTIKNRYRNAVNYMDSLFGNFFDHLSRKEEAIVIVTGDHGEEFFEHGHLFHNSHLTHEQTNIPLYLKFGHQSKAIQPSVLASQMDVFPTLLDYLSGNPVSFLEGHSLFQSAKWPYAVTARFNGGRTPYEFSIHNGKHKLIAQFPNRKQIFDTNYLHILSLRTADDKSVPHFKSNVDSWIQAEFGDALDRLFRD